MFDAKTLLDCTGQLLIRNVTDNFILNFRDVKVHRTINLEKRSVKASTSLPIVMPFDENQISDPADYNNWDWIDPRILVKIIKYTNIDENFLVIEDGWEVNDKHCKVSSNSFDIDTKTSQVELSYGLKECVPPEAGEAIETHLRTIKLYMDKEENYVKRIGYYYEKTTKEFDQQNNAEIDFQGFVEY